MLKLSLVPFLVMASIALADSKSITLSVDTWGDYINKTKPNNGIMTEIVSLSFKNTGIDNTLSWVPWKRIETIEIDNNKAISFGWIKNSERENRWLYSEPFFSSGDIFITHADTGIKWETLKDLKPYKIGVTRGYSHGETFDNAKSWLDIEYANSDKINLKKILARRVDLFPIDPKVAIAEITANFSDQEDKFKFISRPQISNWNTHLVCAKSNTGCKAIINQFNQGLLELKTTGKHNKLIEDFLSITPNQ